MDAQQDKRDVEKAGLARPRYPGAGTLESPFIVDWDVDDPENPLNWPRRQKKWPIISFVSAHAFLQLSDNC